MELFKVGFISIRLLDVLDILFVAFLIYKVFKLFRRMLALQVLLLVVLVFGLWRLVDVFNMALTRTVLDQVVRIGAIALVVVFAPEIRRFVLFVSQNSPFAQLKRQFSGDGASEDTFKELIEASETLASTRTGAIILLEGATDLRHIEQTGDLINADVSKRLLISIFNRASPLHDGAVLVRNNQIVAARCVLPISDDPDIPAELGMRHRAALGITEVSDAAAIVVSEETGKISAAQAGRIKRNLSAEELYNFLTLYYEHAVKLV